MTPDTKSSPAADAGAGPVFAAPYAPPDEAIAVGLMAQATRTEAAERRIDADARRLIEAIRAKAGGLDNLFEEIVVPT